MRNMLVVMICLAFFACAKVSVETKEPIKVDINMRVDVYQHVVKEVDSINDQIYGTAEKEYNMLPFLARAYAQESKPVLQGAIQRRKERLNQIEKYFVMGYIGENRNALLEIRSQLPPDESAAIKSMVEAENNDRETIISEVAQEQGADKSEVRKVFFKKDYERALSGFLFEVLKDGKYVWEEKK
ncbi:MAG: DUF1318 domain-containing protein [Candidatus Omnitrophica bacterium]|nr:DUF1318 domain-containing protein [Candidatus Omnitrophota bacterium]